MALKIGKALLLLIPIAIIAWKLFPLLLSRIERTCNDEISLLFALTICMVVAALTSAAGLSLALGAFLAGLFLGKSDFTHKLALQTQSIRDIFVAFFFVTIGMLIDPRTWITGWRVILLLVALILIGKFGIWTGVVRLFGYAGHTAMRMGVGPHPDWRILVHPRPGLPAGGPDYSADLPCDPGRIPAYDSGECLAVQAPGPGAGNQAEAGPGDLTIAVDCTATWSAAATLIPWHDPHGSIAGPASVA